jgi:hypothetical protein
MNSKWIRMIGIAAVVAVVGVMIVGAVAFAQEPVNGTPTDQYSNFVDADGDGVCDICGNVPGSGQMMHGQGQQGAMGSNFVDADGDGICDNYGAMSQGQRGGQGQHGQRGGHGQHSGQGRSW